MSDDDLTALATLADAAATELLTDCSPADWSDHVLSGEIRKAAGLLRRAGRVLPASVIEVLERSDGC